LDARADVFRRDVAAAERLDEAAMRAEQHLAARRSVVANDDRLATAQVESCNGRLVRHAPRQPQRVDDCFLVVAVVPEARAAERRSECGVVDCDDAAIAGRRLVTEHQLLVVVLGYALENVHVLSDSDQSAYSDCAMRSRCSSLVPCSISIAFASRISFSTG